MSHVYGDIPSAGTKFQIKIATVATDIPGFTDLTWDGYSRAVRNPTHLQSPYVAKRPGMANLGQIKGKLWYDPDNTTHQTVRDRLALSAAAQGAALDDFVVIWADGFTTPAQAEITGFVSEFTMDATDPETGTVSASLTVEVVTLTAHTAGTP